MESKNSKVCKKCGAQIAGDITYCPHCGELLPTKNRKRLVAESLIHDEWVEGDEKFYYQYQLEPTQDGDGTGEQYYSERIVCKLYAKNYHFTYLLTCIKKWMEKMLKKVDTDCLKARKKIGILCILFMVLSLAFGSLLIYSSPIFLPFAIIFMGLAFLSLFFFFVTPDCPYYGGLLEEVEDMMSLEARINIKNRLNPWYKNVGWWNFLQETTKPSFWFLLSLIIGEFAIILFFVFKYLL